VNWVLGQAVEIPVDVLAAEAQLFAQPEARKLPLLHLVVHPGLPHLEQLAQLVPRPRWGRRTQAVKRDRRLVSKKSAPPADRWPDSPPTCSINRHQSSQVRGRMLRSPREGGDESACKPDSVGRVSGPAAIHLGLPSPAASCGLPAGSDGPSSDACAGGMLEHPPFWPCSGWGLPSRPSHLRRWWSLTPPFHPYRFAEAHRRSVFCGTVPRVTPGGCYPPPCPVESGLSSPLNRGGPGSRRGRPAGSSPYHSVNGIDLPATPRAAGRGVIVKTPLTSP
jgi:hypothetical protein